jgi:hypothetical protein
MVLKFQGKILTVQMTMQLISFYSLSETVNSILHAAAVFFVVNRLLKILLLSFLLKYLEFCCVLCEVLSTSCE